MNFSNLAHTIIGQAHTVDFARMSNSLPNVIDAHVSRLTLEECRALASDMDFCPHGISDKGDISRAIQARKAQ